MSPFPICTFGSLPNRMGKRKHLEFDNSHSLLLILCQYCFVQHIRELEHLVNSIGGVERFPFIHLSTKTSDCHCRRRINKESCGDMYDTLVLHKVIPESEDGYQAGYTSVIFSVLFCGFPQSGKEFLRNCWTNL
jgi:hypothetical protein